MGFAVAAGAIGVVNENKNGLWDKMLAPINLETNNYIKIGIIKNLSLFLIIGGGSGCSDLFYITFENEGSKYNKNVFWKSLSNISIGFNLKIYKDENNIYIGRNYLGGNISIFPLKKGTENISLTEVQTLPDGAVELPES